MSAMLLLAAASEGPICTDRPAKANAVCTVPAGKFQLESSPVGWSRSETGGTTTDTLSVGGTVIKYGLSDRSDLQVALTPDVRIRSREAGATSRVSGFGDVVVRFKQRLTGDEAAVQVALIPVAKLPTARRGIGNRKAEGGLAVPVSFSLGGGVTATLGPEVDLLADGDGRGRHAALVNVLSLAGTVAPRLSLAAELWSSLNFDPDGTVKQASADAGVAYAVNPRLQLDGGVNLGLTRETADVEIYAGVSVRF